MSTAPQNLEAEQAVLGAILLSDEAVIPSVLQRGLRPEDFYREQHGTVFAAMVRMYEDRRHVDVLTLAEYLRCLGELERVGGRVMLDALNGCVPGVSHLSEYVRIVMDLAYLRRMRGIALEVLSATERGDMERLRLLVGRAVSLLPKDGLRAVEKAA